jgi:hypothetical protein
MPRSKKLPLKIATGNIALQTPEDSVYALLGFNQFPYKQKTQAEYLSYLRELNLSDLQRHAVEHGVIPNAVSRSVLCDRLEREYLKKKYAYVDVKDSNPVTAKLGDKDEQDIANLLARGR